MLQKPARSQSRSVWISRPQKQSPFEQFAFQVAHLIQGITNQSTRQQGLTLMLGGGSFAGACIALMLSTSAILSMVHAPLIANYLWVCALFFVMIACAGVSLLGCGLYARSKGYPAMGWVVGVFFFNVLAIVALFLAPDRTLVATTPGPSEDDIVMPLGTDVPMTPMVEPAKVDFARHLVWQHPEDALRLRAGLGEK